MATEKQARLIRALQRQVGGKVSTMKQLTPMRHGTVQDWIGQLQRGVNPYDNTEGQNAVLKTSVEAAEEKVRIALAELERARASSR